MLKFFRILIVEDDPGVQELFRNVLTDLGHNVTVVADPPSTRIALDAAVFDVVVIDVGLPGRENGIKLADELRSRKLPMVLVTGHHHLEAELAQIGLRYLLKPFRIDALEDAIKGAVKEAEAHIATRHQKRAD